MQPSLLHRIWCIVNETQTQILLDMSNKDLVEQLLFKLERQRPLSDEENNLVRNYLCSKTALIRDVANSRIWRH